MKILFTACICSVAIAWGAFAQAPTATVTPATSPASPSPAVTATAAASASVSPPASPADSSSSSLASRIHDKVNSKLKHHKGINFTIGDDEDSADATSSKYEGGGTKEIPKDVVPIVAVVMLSLCAVPVLTVALIMYFGFSRNRMMHKTVRMMVEKGQPVPETLLNPPPHVRKRSDMRRGVVLVMIGLGFMIFLGAVTEEGSGAWALGVIPFLIGAGYLLVWKLEGKGSVEAKADNPPPLP